MVNVEVDDARRLSLRGGQVRFIRVRLILIIYLFVIVVTDDRIAQLARTSTLTLLNWTLKKEHVVRIRDQ